MKSIFLIGALVALTACGPVAIAGVTAAGVSDNQLRSTEEALSDAQINLQLDTQLVSADNPNIAGVQTRVNEGRVLLLGTVPRAEDSIEAETIAWSIPGVRAVVNEIEPGGTRSTGTVLRDVGIANAARFRLVNTEGIDPINYTVTVVNGVLHLNGLAPDTAELQRVSTAMSTVSGVEQVVSHVLLIDDPRRLRTESPAISR
jgi:osmotically-inducible protein OsmY